MRFAVLVLLLPLVACAPRGGPSVESSLPEAEGRVDARAPTDVLIEAADSDDPGLSGRALELLIRISPEPGGGDWGGRALFDPNPWVQRMGVEALASRLPDRRAVEYLEEYVRRDSVDPYVRSRAALELAWHGHTGHAEAMSQAWRREKGPWRTAPLALAAAVLGDAEAIAPLGEALAHGNVALEVDFLLDVGNSGLTELLPALRRGSEWAEPEMQLPFAVALVQLGDVSGEGALRKALGDADPEVRLEALDYLTRMDHPAALALLRKAAGQGPDVARWYATLALHARAEADPEVFEQASVHPDREVRVLAVRFAAEAMERADGPDARKLLRSARRAVHNGLADADPVVKMEALRALPAVGLTGEEELVRTQLGDDLIAIRIEAAGALLLLARTSDGVRVPRGG